MIGPSRLLVPIAISVGLLLVGWLAWSAIERNEDNRAMLARLAEQSDEEARLREEIVRLRHGLSANYDRLAQRMALLDEGAAVLAALGETAMPQAQAVGAYRHGLAANARHVEDFKFRNAVIHNSLRYFQHDALRFMRELPDDPAGRRLHHSVTELVNAVLRLSLGGETEVGAEVHQGIGLVGREAKNLPGRLRVELKRLLAHAALIEQHLPALDTSTRNLLAAGIDDRLDEIARRLHDRRTGEADRAARYRLALSLVAAALLVGLTMLGWQYAQGLRQRLATAREMLIAGRFFEESAQGLIITDERGIIQRVNPAFCRISGYPAEELIGHNPRLLKSGRQGKDYYLAMWRELRERGTWQGELFNRRKDGELYVQWLHVDSVRAPDGSRLYVGLSSDMTEIHQARERLAELAYYDTLTGLPNRVLFAERLERILVDAKRERRSVAVLLLDLDNFKSINDSLGHSAGDALLHEVAKRLSACVRESDTVARLSGDEFAALLVDPAVGGDAVAVAAALIETLGRPFQILGFEVPSGASIGITFFPQDGDSAEQLLRNADTAMYRAKELGKNGFQFYTQDMTTSAMESLRLHSLLGQALAQGDLSLHYQAQQGLDGRLVGVEALLRWHNRELGEVSPSRFIPIAEKRGLIGPIGDWVLQMACSEVAEWRRGPLPDLKLAVNLSPVQFRRPDLVMQIAKILAASGLPGSALELEITESTLMEDVYRALAVLGSLKALGCCLAVDDFGTGYSSLSYLRRFPVDVLKIDKSFVDGLGTDANDTAVVGAIVSLANSMGLGIVAEGVETDIQLRELRKLDSRGDMLAQGFLFARPMPAKQLLARFAG
jgi:diguanylate cyclase (GGDEF)-like protein/PAS domain S-box-containing protein